VWKNEQWRFKVSSAKQLGPSFRLVWGGGRGLRAPLSHLWGFLSGLSAPSSFLLPSSGAVVPCYQALNLALPLKFTPVSSFTILFKFNVRTVM